MKQHIEISQLKELSDKAKEKIWEWWKEELGDWCFNPEDSYHKDHPTRIENNDEYNPTNKGTKGQYLQGTYYPLLSIGQMLEFLYEKGIRIGAEDMYGERIVIMPLEWKEKEELCDMLWQQVKEILEQ